jgi:hypothetical protein
MQIAICNASTLVSNEDCQTLATALQAGNGDIAEAWERVSATVFFTTDPSSVNLAEEDCLLVILDDADQAGALGYHATTPTGQAYARVFARDSIAGLKGVDPASLTGVQPTADVLAYVCPVADHEAKEAFIDPEAGGWEDDGSGNAAWAREVCDPVESDSYSWGDGAGKVAWLSDFVTPDFFDPAAQDGPFDHLGSVTGPLELATGGYAIVEQEGAVQQVFGETYAEWRKPGKTHPAARTARRLARHPAK